MKPHQFAAAALSACLSGCAGLTFNPGPQDGALDFYAPAPFLLANQAKDCTVTATVVMLPAYKRSVHFDRGIGSNNLSLELSSSGLITKVGQQTDTKIPETISAIAGLAKAGFGAALVGADKPGTVLPPGSCPPASRLYRVLEGGGLGDATDLFPKIPG